MSANDIALASSSVGTGSKRKRTAQACGPCRTKKTKCDGVHPSCTPCTNLGYECSYPLDSSAPVSAKTVVVTKDYLHLLEERIRKLESNKTVDSPSPSHSHISPLDSTHPRTSSSIRSTSHHPDADAALHHPRHEAFASTTVQAADLSFPNIPVAREQPVIVAREPVIVSPTAGTSTDAPSIDGMGLLLAPERTTPRAIPENTTGTAAAAAALMWATPEGEVYGDTSGISFHRLLIDTLLPGYGCLAPLNGEVVGLGPRNSSEEGEVKGFLSLPPLPDVFTVRPDQLPSRIEARAMRHYYATHTWQLYPFIDLNALAQTYEALLEGVNAHILSRHDPQPQPNPLTLPVNEPIVALQFVIFALVQALTDEQYTKVEILNIALRLLRKHLDWPHSILKVQVLLMGAMVMQGIDCPGYSWDLLGYGVRTAYAIGLQDEAVNKRFPTGEHEMRNRVWWGCYTFDRFLTVTIGRPSAINSDQFTMSLPRPLPGEQEIAVTFFCESIGLYRSLSDIMTNPPATFRGASPELLHSVIHSTYRLETAYATWCDAVDPELNFVNAPPTTHPATVLALRGLTLRLLLHRRVMLTGIRDHLGVRSRDATPPGPATSLRFLEARQREINFGLSIGIIIDTAVFTIRILDKCSEDVGLSAPWYLLFYALNAFMSLIATFLLDLTRWATFIRQSGLTIVNSLHMCQAFVRTISNRYRRPSARQAVIIIDHLMQALGLSSDPTHGVHTLANVALESSGNNGHHSGSNTGHSSTLLGGSVNPGDFGGGTPGYGGGGPTPQAAYHQFDDADMFTNMARGLSDLPHIDFDELSKTLGLDAIPGMDFTDFGL